MNNNIFMVIISKIGSCSHVLPLKSSYKMFKMTSIKIVK